MFERTDILERRTTTDLVFDRMHEEIVSLTLLPGAKLSEAEVARRFGVSRQPVREAFNRLERLDLLVIRPQKATVVRGFSMEGIAHARFVRLAVELEVIQRACEVWDDERAEMLDRNLTQQQQVIDMGQPEKFHAFDSDFHKSICDLGGCPLAAKTINECRQKVERLCTLSLGREREATTLLDDHRRLAKALSDRSTETAAAIVREHLGRLDSVVDGIQLSHAEYFE